MMRIHFIFAIAFTPLFPKHKRPGSYGKPRGVMRRIRAFPIFPDLHLV